MDFKKYLGKHVLDNVEDVIVPDVDLVDDLGNMVNVYFPLEQFEDAPEKLLRTGLRVFYDVDRSVTDILTTAMVVFGKTKMYTGQIPPEHVMIFTSDNYGFRRLDGERKT